MATNENLIPIPGRLHSVATEGHVSGADEIYDDTLQKRQDTINAEVNTAVGTLNDKIGGIEDKIPSQASSSNKLADKDFVNSSISTATATFRGTSAAGLTEAEFLAWANALTKDANDYVFWNTADAAGTVQFKRYKYNGTTWEYEYTLNNSSFTAEQWAAIQSGITSALTTKLSDLPTNAELNTLLTGKQDVISDLSTIRSGASAGATAYHKPSTGIPSTDLTSAVQTSLGKAGTAVQPEDLASVATSGSYDDLTNKPTVPELPEITIKDEYYVDMGLPSGTLWATRNIDVTQSDGFAASAFQYDCSFFSWGNVEGHNPNSSNAFDYDFGSSNDGPYAQTPGAQLTGDIPLTHDAARVNCGGPWKMPSGSQFQELIDNCVFINADGTEIADSQTNKLVTVNGVVGIYLKSKINGNLLFFACSGNGYNSKWYSRGSSGYYWSSSLNFLSDGLDFILGSSGVRPQNSDNRFYGLSIRPIINPSDKTLHKVAVTGNYEDLVGKPHLNLKQDVITDGAQIGLGLGVSTEAATVSDRTAAISNFILLKNMPVTITFNNAINVMDATLNISSTGVKPIFIKGAALQAGVVKAGDVVTLVYDGTNWNITDILTVDVSASDLAVDMGLPSGTKWAVANIDVTTNSGFAEVDGKPSPFKYECSFFSWGNTEGHNPISENAFDYDWGTSNDGPYAQTPGAALTADAGLSFDAARANLGAPWRDPSTEDFVELFNNIDFVQADGETVIDASETNKLVTVNDIQGIYLKSKINSRLLFFACSGRGYGQSWYVRGSNGSFWSRSLYSQTRGRYLLFYSGGVYPQHYNNRFGGFARRAVQ